MVEAVDDSTGGGGLYDGGSRLWLMTLNLMGGDYEYALIQRNGFMESYHGGNKSIGIQNGNRFIRILRWL
jgi:hypothetical protein